MATIFEESKSSWRPSTVLVGMPSFRCADLGMDCAFQARALSLNGLMKKIRVHASDVHKILSMPGDLEAKIRSEIQ